METFVDSSREQETLSLDTDYSIVADMDSDSIDMLQTFQQRVVYNFNTSYIISTILYKFVFHIQYQFTFIEMGKGKNKNKNKTVDVVAEVENEKKEEEETETQEQEITEENKDEGKGNQEQIKTEEKKPQQQKQVTNEQQSKIDEAPQATQYVTVTEQTQPSEPQVQATNQNNKQTEQATKPAQAQKLPEPQAVAETTENAQTAGQIKATNEEIPIQSDTNLSQMSQDLRDGLELVGKVAQQVLCDPLAHEKIAHGEPQFNQNPLQTVFTEQSPTLEPHAQQKTFLGLSLQQTQENNQSLQEVKQSTESVEPQNMQQKDKINILNSYHSEKDEEIKNQPPAKPKPHQQGSGEKQPISERKYSQQRKTSVSIIPISSQNFLQLSEQQKKDIDYDKLNSDMLAQREKQWQKIQSKTTLPAVLPYQFTHPSPIIDAGPPAKPYVPEHLGYTNNLPIITHQREVRKESGEIDERMFKSQNKNPYEEEKKVLKKKQQEVKKKLEENQKLRKNLNNDQPLKKLGISALVTAACLGACVLGKLDKKLSAGVSIASFITSYLIQK